MQFTEGIRAHVYVSWLNPYKEQKLTVVCSDGMIVFDDTQLWDKKLVLYKDYLAWEKGMPNLNKSTGKFVNVEQSEPLRNECLHFLECCKERKTPKTNGEEGLRVLELLSEAQSSLDKNN